MMSSMRLVMGISAARVSVVAEGEAGNLRVTSFAMLDRRQACRQLVAHNWAMQAPRP